MKDREAGRARAAETKTMQAHDLRVQSCGGPEWSFLCLDCPVRSSVAVARQCARQSHRMFFHIYSHTFCQTHLQTAFTWFLDFEV